MKLVGMAMVSMSLSNTAAFSHFRIQCTCIDNLELKFDIKESMWICVWKQTLDIEFFFLLSLLNLLTSLYPPKIFVFTCYFLGNFVKLLRVHNKTTSAKTRDIDKRFVKGGEKAKIVPEVG